ncbi:MULTISPECIES: malate dehydrogenase [Candidatus Ichthyocystis]|uniref:Malate dehydrogenase n=1 Tax=Candidatus Ichthyocystis hellenicum TaxID=1561003 RepID=A0A0S4M735_9BURK|nr:MULTISPECIES: malate dehydrogenase [Ichthyocystis]CUT18086.1 Malate dehydrogenase [Candidatus Ichthyocystis hellenicum]
MTSGAIRISVSGAAGQIAYSLLFSIARGNFLGPNQPIALQLLEITPAMDALKGVVMELLDCAFPLLDKITVSDDPDVAFRDADYIFLVGSKPRQKGQERRHLLEQNASIFKTQGMAINNSASRQVKVLIVGNPANTNALIAASNAPELKKTQFSGMVRLDQNRALSLLASHMNSSLTRTNIQKLSIWGNHSPTMFPDLSLATVDGEAVIEKIEHSWYEDFFIKTVAQRGTAVINARGSSSAASAASAAIDHMRDWALGSQKQEWSSMAVFTGNTYAPLIPEGLYCGMPCICLPGGEYEIVKDISLNEFAKEKIAMTVKELEEERDVVRKMLGQS